MMSTLDRYRHVLDVISQAAVRSGRPSEAVRLVAVTKSQCWEAAVPLYQAGQRAFGESRLPEALQKKAAAPPDCHWHWIGTLQKNKVRKVVGEFVLIHSVDSIDLARKVSQVSGEEGVVARVLLQANMSGEASKHGLAGEAWKDWVEELLALPNLSVAGMMTMAAVDADERAARLCFAQLRSLRDELRALSGNQLPLTELSMGMSRDFAWAIEEGATLVRVGSALWHD